MVEKFQPHGTNTTSKKRSVLWVSVEQRIIWLHHDGMHVMTLSCKEVLLSKDSSAACYARH